MKLKNINKIFKNIQKNMINDIQMKKAYKKTVIK